MQHRLHMILASVVFIASIAPSTSFATAYPEINCATQKAFESNSCDQCFDGGTIKAGDTLGRLIDTWTNRGSNDQIAYKDEQKWPDVVNIGGSNTLWSMNPKDPNEFWTYGKGVIWTKAPAASGSVARDQFILGPGKNVSFIEADALGSTYTLVSTDKKNGELIGLAKFPVVYRETDAFGKEGAADTHYECVAYKAPVIATTPKPIPPKATQTQTGPQEVILVIAALLLGLLTVLVVKKKSI
ncbi:MAG: hypothetical protein U0518_00640 [Candidatus Gracilibacteria bacterium]